MRGNKLDRMACETLLGVFARDVEAYLNIIPVSADTISASIEVARTFGLRPGDAIHCATAQNTGRAVPGDDFVFVAADRGLLEVATRERMDVLDPEAPDAIRELWGYRKV